MAISDVARVVSGHVVGNPSEVISGVSIDSRATKPGQMFAAVKGDFLDGHDYIRAAFSAGGTASLVSRVVHEAGGTQVLVSDVGEALKSLATWVRAELDPIVVGITGSTGKTSTKDLLRDITSTQMKTVASERSFNNDLGVPLTILETKVETEVVICEMGARGIGQIAELCKIARPQVGVVTNVGVTHYEQFGSRDAIANAKSELVRSLDEGHTAILNGDDPLVRSMASRTKAEVLYFGQSDDNDVRAEGIRLDRLGRPTFRISHGDDAQWVTLPLSGEHQVANALAAAAAGIALGLDLDDVRRGLENAKLSPWRMEVMEAAGIVFINDAYNANPTSVAAALNAAAAIATESGRLIAILGHMAELGEISESEHHRVGALAASLAHQLIVVGDAATPVAEGAHSAGLENVIRVKDATEALSAVGELLAGDVVLVKGSRVAGLEELASEMLERVAAT